MVYDVPVGKGKAFSTNNAVLDYALGNWQVNVTATFASGTPMTARVLGGFGDVAGGVNGTPQVTKPSFHRAPAGDPTVSPFYVANPNPASLTNPGPWLDTDPNHAFYKYLVLRPRPA